MREDISTLIRRVEIINYKLRTIMSYTENDSDVYICSRESFRNYTDEVSLDGLITLDDITKLLKDKKEVLEQEIRQRLEDKKKRLVLELKQLTDKI